MKDGKQKPIIINTGNVPSIAKNKEGKLTVVCKTIYYLFIKDRLN